MTLHLALMTIGALGLALGLLGLALARMLLADGCAHDAQDTGHNAKVVLVISVALLVVALGGGLAR